MCVKTCGLLHLFLLSQLPNEMPYKPFTFWLPLNLKLFLVISKILLMSECVTTLFMFY